MKIIRLCDLCASSAISAGISYIALHYSVGDVALF